MENYNFYAGYIKRKQIVRDKEKSMGAVLALVGVVLLYVGIKMMIGV